MSSYTTKPKVIGKYEVCEEIGSGSFGKVNRCVHVDTRKEYAMKIMSIEKIKLNKLTDQVKREISILRTLDHPHIVKLVEVLKNNKNMFLITELISNGDLFDRLALQQQFSESEARKLFAQMLDAISYCHGRGVCHRDLKLENILLTVDMQVKVCDLGFANAFLTGSAQEEILLKTLCGTPSSIPAEILRHERYHGSRVDVWALGVILYAMVAGVLPFPQDDNDELFAAIIAGEYTIPDFFSKPLSDLIKGMINVNSEQRLTIVQIQEHQWMTSDAHDPATVGNVSQNMPMESQDTVMM